MYNTEYEKGGGGERKGELKPRRELRDGGKKENKANGG
jgi:hypothetical protein